MDWADDFKRPATMVSLAVAAISMVLSVVFFFEARQTQRPTYLISSAALIFDSSISSPKLQLMVASKQTTDGDKLEPDNAFKRVSEDAYVLAATIWNDGEVPIDANEVRSPVTLLLKGATEVLDYSIADTTDAPGAEFTLSDPSDGSPAVVLNWTHLDPGVGIKLQVIYSATGPVEPTVVGGFAATEFVDGSPVVSRMPKTVANAVLTVLLVAFFAVFQGLRDVVRRRSSIHWAIREPLVALPFVSVVYLAYVLLAGATPPL